LKRFEELLSDSKSSFDVGNIGDSAGLDRAADKLTTAIFAAGKKRLALVGKGLQEQTREVRRLQNKKKVIGRN
jgi:hypothetical protein